MTDHRCAHMQFPTAWCADCDPAMPVEHTIEPLRGYRTWDVVYTYSDDDTGPLYRRHIAAGGSRMYSVVPPRIEAGLFALTSYIRWREGVNTAYCQAHLRRPHPGPAPDVSCGCGLYAYDNPRSIDYFGYGEVLGVVEGAGRIVKHETGWRSAKARIVALSTRNSAVAEMIRAEYPNTVFIENPDDLVHAYPPMVVR